ncbi:MAG TPA: substrate-binding domain-containing protein, partial [Micromonosporaceae bacterium]|nr:substrate-binding domain-containing protein [Micromonosporaceae bacterium]
ARRTALYVALTLALVSLTTFAVQLVAADREGCSARHEVRLTVAASPEVAPAVQEAAQRWHETGPEVDGECIRVQVRAAASAEVAGALAARVGGRLDVADTSAPTPSGADLPAVWIPDSVAWLNRLRGVDRAAVVGDTPSSATSPVVLAVPEPVARDLFGRGSRSLTLAALRQLVDRLAKKELTLALVDPRRDTAGLAGAMLLRTAIVTSEERLAVLVFAYRGIGKLPDQAALRQAYSQGLQLSTMSEQAVLAYNGAGPSVPLVAVPLAEGGPVLDYPFALLSGVPRDVEQAATQFRAALADGRYRDVFGRYGFRAPDGVAPASFPIGRGASADPIVVNAVAKADAVQGTLDLWTAAVEPSRTLALLDVTSSMGQQLRPGVTKLGVLRAAAKTGLALFADESQVGIWAFAASLPTGQHYLEAVPIARLDRAQRDRITRSIEVTRPSGTNECALYESLLAAYRKIKDGYAPDRTNRVVVFTDGRNTVRGMNLERLQRELELLGDVTRPVKVTLVGVGADVDMDELNAIAVATGAEQAFQVLNPNDIEVVFLHALLS